MASSRLAFEYFRSRPFIPVCISIENRITEPFRALVDSGADVNLFPAVIGLMAGIDVRRGEARKVMGIGGVELDTFYWKINLAIISRRPEIFETGANFCFEQIFPVLGRKGFFDLYKKVGFSEKRGVVELVL
ncbi:MAG: hypothetical protein AAB599_02860 [Patescibacteria group bacterium]